jgi:tRNA(Ile)-lysidine synthase
MKQIIDLLNQSIKNIKKQKLIVSVSGGVDSMALLHLLHMQNYELIVVHFNHLKRDQSIYEAEMVQDYCESKHIPFHYFTINVEENGNFHHQAHLLRQHYLLDVAKETKSNYILTAHHLDDLLESILIKFTRGSNLLGYAGMQYIYEKNHIHYVKPFLYVSKEQLIDYAKKENIPFMQDESNEENAYLRNRYRHAIVPIMKQENQQLLDTVKQYHEQVSDAFHFIRKTSLNYIEDGSINLSIYKTLDKAIQQDIVAYLLEKNKIDANYEKVMKIVQMLQSSAPNQSYRLNDNYVFIKAYDKANIETFNTVDPIFYKLSLGKNILKNMEFFTFLDDSSIITEEFTKLCYNELAFPLWIRHRLNGDILTYDYGHKKLKKLLIDQKIPMKKRNQLWVLTDNNNQILWVQDFYLNKTLGNKHTLYFKSKGANHA